MNDARTVAPDRVAVSRGADRGAEERAAFLQDACGADEALRREIESLFEVESRAKDFMERPAAPDRLAGAVRGLEPAAEPGRFVGAPSPYEVHALIAAGGMGEVYRAVDTRLSRPSRSKRCRDTRRTIRSVAPASCAKRASSPA